MGERVEIIMRRGRRRSFSVEEKLRIVEETRAPGATVLDVAARHDLHANLVYVWRRMAEGRPARRADGKPAGEPAVGLVPVRLVGRSVGDIGLEAPARAPVEATPGRIEITLPGGAKVKVEGEVAPERLAAVLTILSRAGRLR